MAAFLDSFDIGYDPFVFLPVDFSFIVMRKKKLRKTVNLTERSTSFEPQNLGISAFKLSGESEKAETKRVIKHG